MIIKSLHELEPLRRIYAARGDRVTLIARNFKGDGGGTSGDSWHGFPASKGGYHGDPSKRDAKAEAAYWFEIMLPYLREAPFAYWESFNEPNTENNDDLAAYARFEAERAYLMAREGYRACLGNFSVGTPDVVNPAVWECCYPMLEAAHQTRSLLGLHEYAPGWMDLYYAGNLPGRRTNPFPEVYSEGWYVFRYRKVWRQHILPNQWTDLRIALTEFGLMNPNVVDEVRQWLASQGLEDVGAWNSRQTRAAWEKIDGRTDAAQYFVEMLRWANRQLMKDPYVAGACLWTWGQYNFPDDEVNGEVADAVLADMAVTY